MKLTLTLDSGPKLDLLAAETQAISKALRVATALSQLTSGHDALTDLHLRAEGVRDSLASLFAAIDSPDATGGHKAVEDAAAELIAKGTA